jgi:dephospho-CoA kinase
MIEHPQDHLLQARAAIGAGSAPPAPPPAPHALDPGPESGGESSPPASTHPHTPFPTPAAQVKRAGRPGGDRPLPIVGLAGGIGAGKSEVASILERLGCFVIDSDQQARQALDRPEVREQLIQWWGRGILKPSPNKEAIDRSQVARIVFAHEDQRRRLEGLIHPLVRARREDLIRDARAAGARAAVIDAPLLFEAGVDEECDAIIFVDAPRAMRVQRVRENRGWDEAELDRRERAQLPLEEKRRRSTHLVTNGGDRDALAEQVAHVLTSITGG